MSSERERRRVTFEDWETDVPAALRSDPLWRAQAYRTALFVSDLAWFDAETLLSDRRARSVADQLCRSAGGINADIREGYSRSTSRDRARFLEYALGSSREARDWYYKARHVLSSEVVEQRTQPLTELVKLLTTMVVNEK